MTVQGSVLSHKGTHRRSHQTPDSYQLHRLRRLIFVKRHNFGQICSAETLACLPALLVRHEVVAQPCGDQPGTGGARGTQPHCPEGTETRRKRRHQPRGRAH